jgi:hypothetical protein
MVKRLAGPLALGAAASLLGPVGCKSPMAKIDAVRDALVADDASAIRDATAGYAACADGPPVVVPPGKPGPRDEGCLSEIANGLGSKLGFRPNPPDHAAATTAAIVILRDGRGDWIAHADTWLSDIKNGRGAGHDALRLAVARKMAEAAPVVGRKLDDDDAAARGAMRAIVGAVPGACPTYWLLGSGVDPKTIPPELNADHSACVQKDLSRREGPGGSYGSGRLRALEGALALWRETERALRIGLPLAAPGPKAVLEKKLAIIEAATRKIETKKMDSTLSSAMLGYMGEVHAEAGIPIFETRDGGAGADSEAPTPPLRRPMP